MILTLRRFSKRKAAKAERDKALARVRDAESRRDSRDLSKARADLQAATAALLKVETVKVRR